MRPLRSRLRCFCHKAVYLYAQKRAGNVGIKIGNDFQNIERAQKRFAEFSLDPFDQLTDHERDILELNIQKRHVIGHNLGVVDDKFAKHAADAN